MHITNIKYEGSIGTLLNNRGISPLVYYQYPIWAHEMVWIWYIALVKIPFMIFICTQIGNFRLFYTHSYIWFKNAIMIVCRTMSWYLIATAYFGVKRLQT